MSEIDPLHDNERSRLRKHADEDAAFVRCRALIGHLVCREITELEFSGGVIDCLIDAPLSATKRALQGMPADMVSLLLLSVESLENIKGIRNHQGFINDGMSVDERRIHYEKTAENAMEVCSAVRNRLRKTQQAEQGAANYLELHQEKIGWIPGRK